MNNSHLYFLESIQQVHKCWGLFAFLVVCQCDVVLHVIWFSAIANYITMEYNWKSSNLDSTHLKYYCAPSKKSLTLSGLLASKCDFNFFMYPLKYVVKSALANWVSAYLNASMMLFTFSSWSSTPSSSSPCPPNALPYPNTIHFIQYQYQLGLLP